ncbi:MAG TPA: hypothetical protein VLS90_04220 [Thermodesulfobacteriota bacterium]|nr:hypothetical protein [Thermodesulfobacteriota bacterium]
MTRVTAQEWLERGADCYSRKDFRAAKSAFTAALEMNEGFLFLQNQAAAMHMRYGNQGMANRDLERIHELETAISRACRFRAMASRELGEYQDSIRDLDRAVALAPGDASNFLERGRTRERAGDLRGAVDDYTAALKRDRGNADILCERAAAYLKLEFYPLALCDGADAVVAAPRQPAAYLYRGLAYLRIGKKAEGARDLEKARDLGSHEAGRLLNSL